MRSYLRDYERDLQHYDGFLRLRESIDEYPGQIMVERKTRYIFFPDGVELGTDRAVRYRDQYRMVMVVRSGELPYVRRSLALTDVQRLGGAKVLEARINEAEDKEKELRNRAMQMELEAMSSDAFDFLAWREGRRVSMGGHGWR